MRLFTKFEANSYKSLLSHLSSSNTASNSITRAQFSTFNYYRYFFSNYFPLKSLENNFNKKNDNIKNLDSYCNSAKANSSAFCLPSRVVSRRFISGEVSTNGITNISTSNNSNSNSGSSSSNYNNSFVKCIQKEIEDENLRFDDNKVEPEIPRGWEIKHDLGTSFFTMTRHWQQRVSNDSINSGTEAIDDSSSSSSSSGGVCLNNDEIHYVRVQLTTRDTSLDPEFDIRGEHFPFTILILKNNNDNNDNDNNKSNTDSKTKGKKAGFDKARFDTMGDLEEEEVVDLSCDVIESEFIVDSVRCYPFSVLSSYFESTGSNSSSNNSVNSNSDGSDGIKGDSSGIINNNNIIIKENNINGKTHVNAAEKGIFRGKSISEKIATLSNLAPEAQFKKDHIYPGPSLDQTEDEVLDGLQAWLAEREFDDVFAEFIAQYSAWIEQLEYENWLRELQRFLVA